MLRNSFVFLLSRTIRHDAGAFMITPLRQYRYSAITNTKLRDNYNLLQKQSQVSFDPQKFALGFLGGSAGSLAVSKGFKLLKEKPELKEALKKELADTLSKGWESASAKYPLLKSLEPVNRIMQSEKGKIAQAGHLLNKLEQKEAKGLANVTYNGKNASLVYKDLENIDEAILYAKGTSR